MQIDEMSLEGKGIDINAVITELISNNKKMISYYDSLSLDIPKNTWLTYFYAREGGNVAVEGLSLGINGIYEYFKGIKNSIPTSSVRLTKLRALTDILDSTYDPKAKGEAKIYEFEISNTASKKNGGGIPAADAQPAGEATGEPSDLEPIMMGD